MCFASSPADKKGIIAHSGMFMVRRKNILIVPQFCYVKVKFIADFQCVFVSGWNTVHSFFICISRMGTYLCCLQYKMAIQKSANTFWIMEQTSTPGIKTEGTAG